MLRQHLAQFRKSAYRRTRRALVHRRTDRSVEHPSRQGYDIARTDFHMNNNPGRTLLAVLTSDTAPIERVPLVEDFNFLPDMGRMTL